MGVQRGDQAEAGRRRLLAREAHDGSLSADADPGGPTVHAILALQRSAGNHAVSTLVREPRSERRLQRQIVVTGSGPTDTVDLVDALRKHKIAGARDVRAWFASEIVPRLGGVRFSYPRFAGYLFARNPEYVIKVETGSALGGLSFNELNDAVARSLRAKVWGEMFEQGRGAIGNVRLLGRGSFPTEVKKAFAKGPLVKETNLEKRQIHLRHFVMGSWFRALPDVFARAKLTQLEEADLAARVQNLIPAFGKLAGAASAQASGKPADDVKLLAGILHDLTPNLNAGEGPENSLIGFLSHGFSDLAEEFRSSNTSVARDEVEALVEAAIAHVGLVDTKDRQRWVQEFDPVGVFEAMLAARVGPTDPPPAQELAVVMHEFAFALGIDFMKRQTGLATQIQSLGPNVIAQLQAALIPVGELVYSTIVAANARAVDVTDLAKLLNGLEVAATTLTSLLATTKH